MLVSKLRLRGWRLQPNAALVVQELRVLVGGVNVAGEATVSSSVPPDSGTIEWMTDGDSGTECTWSAEAAQAPGFYIELAFVSPVDMSDVVVATSGDTVRGSVLTWDSGAGWSVVAYSIPFEGGVSFSGRFEYPYAVLVDEPFIYLRCDDKVGTSVVDSVGGNTTFAVPAYAQRVLAPANEPAGFLAPSGINDRRGVVYSADPSVGRLSNQFTLSFLVTPNGGGGDVTLAIKELGGVNWPEWHLSASASGQITLEIYTTNGPSGLVSLRGTVGALRFGRRNHIELVRNGQLYQCYVNGVLDINGSAPAGPWSGNTNLSFLGRYLSGYDLPVPPGVVSDIAFFAKALSGAQIARHYEALPNPAGQWLEVSVSESQAISGSVVQSSGVVLVGPQRVLDMEHGGNGCIYGTVELYVQAGNIPLPRRVRLHRSRDGMLVRETWSDAQGNYRFDGISERYTYDVIAWDHEGLQQSVVANDLTPEVMP